MKFLTTLLLSLTFMLFTSCAHHSGDKKGGCCDKMKEAKSCKLSKEDCAKKKEACKKSCENKKEKKKTT